MYKIYADNVLFFDNSLQMVDDQYKVIDPKLTMELNKAGSLEFTLPPSNLVYNTIEKLKTTIHVLDDTDTEIWRGRILHDEKDFYNRKNVYCEGALSFLHDGIIRPYDYSGTVQYYLKTILYEFEDQVGTGRKISYRSSSDAVEDPNNYIVRSNIDYTKTLDELTDKLLNKLGGYFKLIYLKNNFNYIGLEYVNNYGQVSDQVIQFGENLLDLKEYISAENIFTVLIPLGKKAETQDGTEGERLTIKTVNGGKDYLENQTAVNLFGKIWNTNVWDDVTIAGNLLTKGREYLNQNIQMSVTLSIKAVDLHYIDVDTSKLKLGDNIRVLSVPHGLDAYFNCSKVVLNFNDPSKDEFTLGVSFSGLTDKQISNQKKSNSAFSMAENTSNAVSNISTNVQGNYVQRNEFLNYQTQVNNNFTAVNNKLTAVFHYKGTVNSFSNLPTSGNTIGDVWNVSNTGANYAWNGSEWDKLSETVDLSGLVSVTDFNSLVARVEALEG